MAKVKDFTDLEVWRLGRQIRHDIYKITSNFPASERPNLVGQMRRAAVSMTANIAEGFGRFSYRENRRACLVSRGEACELQDHALSCLDEGLIDHNTFEGLERQLGLFLRLLNGYIRSIGTGHVTSDP